MSLLDDKLKRWYSVRVTTLSTAAVGTNNINRYRGKRLIGSYTSTKIQFMRREFMEVAGPYEAFYVTAKYECRPDLLAQELYGSSLYAWAILAVNNFKTVYEMRTGEYINVPQLAQVMEVS